MKFLTLLFKIAIFAALILLLYFQLQNGLQRVGERELYFWQKGISFLQLVYLILAIVLMPLNWGLELVKWRSLMYKAEQLDTKIAFIAMLAGITFALFTPNRIGEYGGRVLFVKPEQRLRTVFETLKGSIAQWLAILTGGVIGICSIVFKSDNEKALELSYYLLAFALPMFLLMMVLYFRLRPLAALISGISYLKRFVERQLEKERYRIADSILIKTYLWALLRYLVYTLQYLLILYAFGIENEPFLLISAISLVYLIQTGLPLPPALGLVARGSIAVWIFGIFGDGNFQEQSIVLAATFSLWCINLLVPAFFGSYFIANAVGFRRKAD
jgi:uncharacterized integral membrane protein